MAEPFRVPFPMLRVQYDLLGGNRRMFTVLGIAAFVLVAGFLGYRRLFQSAPLPMLAGQAINLLGGIQLFFLVLGGCSGVYRAMLRDHDTRMLESHRLTPMSNSAVALGYLLGANVQTLALCTLVALYGTVLCFVAGTSAAPWLAGNLLVLMGASTLWAITVIGGLRLSKPLNPTGFLVVAGMFGMLWLFLLPGAGLMLAAYATVLGASMMWGFITPSLSVMGLLCGLHLFLTIFWLMVAAEKYRRPDLPALNGARGLVFLVIWLLLASVGVVLFHPIARSINFPTDDFPSDVMWSVALGASILAALVPINGAVECRVLAQRGSSMRGLGDRLPSWLVVLLATFCILVVTMSLGYTVWIEAIKSSDSALIDWLKLLRELDFTQRLRQVYLPAWGPASLAVLAALLAARAVFCIGHALRLRDPKVLIGLYVVVFWAVPPFGDLIFSEIMREYGREAHLTWIYGSSPGGTMAIIWNGAAAPLISGLLVQCGLALFLSLLAHRLMFGRRTQAV